MAVTRVQQHRRKRRWVLPVGRRRPAGVRRSALAIEVPATSVPDGWFCFREVDLGGEIASFVVAGVRGVFVVEAYATADRVSADRSGLVVSGRSARDLVQTALRRAAMLGASIGTGINPLIVFQADEVEEGWCEEVQVAAVGNLRSLLLHADARRMSWDELKRVRSELAKLAA